MMHGFISVLATTDPTQTHSWILPETSEIIYGGIASVLVFSLLAKVAGPLVKKAFADRTSRVQGEMDNASAALEKATVEAERIRSALGDVSSERTKLLAAADAEAATVLAEGRARIEAEAVDLIAKAEADIAAASARVGDELKSEIARLSSLVVENVVRNALNDAAQQDLIEGFINNVGAAR